MRIGDWPKKKIEIWIESFQFWNDSIYRNFSVFLGIFLGNF